MNNELIVILESTLHHDEKITSTTQLEEDLGFTSMKMILFLSKVCKSLSIKMIDLDADKIDKFKTVGELLNYLEEFKKQKL